MKDKVISVIKNLKENDSYIFCVNSEDGIIIFESGDSRKVFSKLVEHELDALSQNFEPVDAASIMIEKLSLIVENWVDQE